MIVGSILVLSVSIITVSHSRLSQRTKDLVVANSYIEGKVESLRSKGFNGLSDGTTTITGELPSELKAPRSGTLVTATHSASIKSISVSVTYNDQGTNRTYSYTTYIGELGAGQY